MQATAVTDAHFQAQVASLLTESDLVFGFSLSGRTKDTFDSLNVAKHNGATIIAITNYLNTPIGKQGDLVLQTAMQEFFNGGSVAGRVSQLYICDVITRDYENKNTSMPWHCGNACCGPLLIRVLIKNLASHLK